MIAQVAEADDSASCRNALLMAHVWSVLCLRRTGCRMLRMCADKGVEGAGRKHVLMTVISEGNCSETSKAFHLRILLFSVS
jgi:hypothetical protein